MFGGKALRCDCGYRLTARVEAAQVAEIQRHALEAHGAVFSADDALLVLLRSELDSNGEPRFRPGKEEGK
jgi:hypothetical protein